jgi:hypothetical protein
VGRTSQWWWRGRPEVLHNFETVSIGVCLTSRSSWRSEGETVCESVISWPIPTQSDHTRERITTTTSQRIATPNAAQATTKQKKTQFQFHRCVLILTMHKHAASGVKHQSYLLECPRTLTRGDAPAGIEGKTQERPLLLEGELGSNGNSQC